MLQNAEPWPPATTTVSIVTAVTTLSAFSIASGLRSMNDPDDVVRSSPSEPLVSWAERAMQDCRTCARVQHQTCLLA